MLVANPCDVVQVLLGKPRQAPASALLGETVEELEYRATEVRAEVPHDDQYILVLRLDFEAKIRLATGEQKLVLIELQKARSAWDLMRFRRYLATQYANANNVYEDGGGRSLPLPIVTIYFLGEALEHTDASVVRVNRVCRDAITDEPVAPEKFIESLTHDSFVVQIPKLRGRRRNELEQLLTVFDQGRVGRHSHHEIEIDEEELPERYGAVVRRLMRAMAEPKVRVAMDVEDDVVEHLHDMDRKLEAKDKALAAKDEALAEARRLIAELEARARKR